MDFAMLDYLSLYAKFVYILCYLLTNGKADLN